MNGFIRHLSFASLAFAMSACHGSDTPAADVTGAVNPSAITGAGMKPFVRQAIGSVSGVSIRSVVITQPARPATQVPAYSGLIY